MAAQHLTQLKITPRPAQADLDAALGMFLLDCRARHLSPRSVEFYDWQLHKALDYLAGRNVNSLAGITPTHIRAYLLALQERKLSDSSQHAAARALRAWLNWCVTEELLTVSPMDKVRMPKRSKEILPAFSDSDVSKLLAAVKGSSRDTALLLVLLDTGVRAAECVALDVGDVAADGTVTVRQGKGGKDRVTFLGAAAHKAMRRYLMSRSSAQPSEPLWLSGTTGERLTQSGLRQVLERIGRASEVENCHAHTFRRTFAIWSLRAGMDIFALQRLMGHADLAVLRRYLDQNRADLEAAHAAHGAVDALLKAGKR